MNDLDLLIDLHLCNDRLGPGGDDETRRAIELAGVGERGACRIADIGCGTGASSLVLASELDASVVAVDAAEPFVGRVRERAAAAGLSNRIEAQVARMEALPFDEGQFDVLWSEAAIYNMGFESGLRAWRHFLRPGGVLAVSELSWTTARRPAAIESYWTREYPGISVVSANVAAMEREGYQPLGVFALPPACWEENYYRPLQAGFAAYLDRHAHADAARDLVRAEEAEMALYREYGEWYGYVFYLGRKVGSPAG